MEQELKDRLLEMALQRLAKTPAGEKIQQAMSCYQAAREHILALLDSEDGADIVGMKAVTVLTFAVLKKIAQGKAPTQLDRQDWRDIASAVSRYAILADGQAYSVFIFGVYEKSIRACAEQLSDGDAPSERVRSIAALADDLAENARAMQAGEISEMQYTEACLWTSLEAAIKLVAAFSTRFAGYEAAELGQAAAAFAFECGRLMLYKREQEMVTQFVQGQYQLDAELERKYAEYLAEVETQTREFLVLVDHAFAPDFKSAFLQSVLLARAAGVDAEELPTSLEGIDAYFME